MKSALASLSQPLSVSPRLTGALRRLGLYAGAATSAVLFADWAVRRYAFSPFLVDALLLTLVLAVPTVLALALPDRANPIRWWRRRRFVALVNAFAALALLTTLFHDKPLGATLQMVTVPSEGGGVETRAVAHQAFRTRVAVAPLSGDADAAQPVAEALATVLGADLYVTAFEPSTFASDLQRAGLATDAAPEALLRDAARKMAARHLVSGRAERDDDAYRIDLRLTPLSGGAPHTIRAEGTDLLALVDRAAADVRRALDLPAAAATPTADLLTASAPALSAFARAKARYQFDADYAGAADLLDEAVRLDPTFAFAHLYTHSVRSALGEDQEAGAALARAQQHRYRLPEATRLRLTAVQARDEGRIDDAVATARSSVALFPDDLGAHHLLSDLLHRAGKVEDAVQVLREALPIDPSSRGTFTRLQHRLRETAGYDEALEHALAFGRLNPDDWTVPGWTGALYADMNRHEEALASFERGALLNPQHVEFLESAAATQAKLGRWDEADRTFARALALASTARDSAIVLRSTVQTDELRGRLAQAAARADLASEAMRRHAPPVEALRYALQNAHLRARSGDLAYVDRMLRATLAELPPGASQAEGRVRRSAAYAFALSGQHAKAAQQSDAARALLESMGTSELLTLDAVVARRLGAEGRHAEAARALDASADFQRSAHLVFVERAEQHLLAGDARAARADSEHVLTLFPSHPRAHLTLAHLSQGAERQQHLRAALSAWQGADPEFAPLAEAQRLAGAGER
jgi:tetratricopeptide (TPR) repeat protein